MGGPAADRVLCVKIRRVRSEAVSTRPALRMEGGGRPGNPERHLQLVISDPGIERYEDRTKPLEAAPSELSASGDWKSDRAWAMTKRS